MCQPRTLVRGLEFVHFREGGKIQNLRKAASFPVLTAAMLCIRARL
jgi:hypothetical protein